MTTRCGFAAIIGAPNAGKSTLINALVGTKIAIVSPKVQTTRMPVRGIAMAGETQIVFVDTPGIFRPRRRLDRAMVTSAWAGAEEADCVLLIVALKGEGVGDVASWVASRMPPGPWLYPEDQAADIPSRLLAAEVTREKIYLRLHDELPYSSAVETEKWEERRDGSVKIDQIIYVQREGQKAIVLGKGGATIKIIGALAREELEVLFGRRVHLFLFVQVREDWAEKSEHYREIGLEFPHEK